MKHIYITFGVAVLLIGTGGAHAQQQQFGRDSVYAVPGKSSRPSAPASQIAAPVSRFGRDSVYVSQTPDFHSTPVSADAQSLQQYGRDSVYAHESPNSPKQSNEVKVDATSHGHGG